jgi:flavin reductase (DIM6/NTAB) family NADH-FMN oxidoreductase RutF
MSIACEAAFDSRAFRRALGQFPTGVCVVTGVADGERLGVTMSSFNSLSLDPPLVLFSIDRRAASLPLWERAEGYAVNILSENQREVSNRFARPHSNKWEGARFSRGLSEPPLLNGVAAAFDCVPFAKHDGGDHRLFIARVTGFWSSADRAPLVFSSGRYASLQSTEFAAPLWPLDIHY